MREKQLRERVTERERPRERVTERERPRERERDFDINICNHAKSLTIFEPLINNLKLLFETKKITIIGLLYIFA